MDGERHAAVVGCHRLDVGVLLYAIGGKIHRGHVARQPADLRILMLIYDNETFACGLHAPPAWATSIAVVPEDRLFGASMGSEGRTSALHDLMLISSACV